MSNSLQPRGLQHTRPPWPSPIPGVYSNSCPLSRWCHPTISSSANPSPPALNLSQHQGLFQWVSSSHQVKFWSFSFSFNPSNDYSGLISFRMDLLDLLAVQETLKSLLQHHSSKTSILRCSVFFIVLLSHPFMTSGKTIALTRWIFVGKVMSLLFNILSGLVITFLPRSKHLLISWLQSPSAVILEPKKIKSVTVSTVVPSPFQWHLNINCNLMTFKCTFPSTINCSLNVYKTEFLLLTPTHIHTQMQYSLCFHISLSSSGFLRQKQTIYLDFFSHVTSNPSAISNSFTFNIC